MTSRHWKEKLLSNKLNSIIDKVLRNIEYLKTWEVLVNLTKKIGFPTTSVSKGVKTDSSLGTHFHGIG